MPLGLQLAGKGAEAPALVVGEPPGDPEHLRVRNHHQEPAGEADLAGEAGPLPAQRILRDLDQHRLAGLQGLLDAAGPLDVLVPVHLAGVQDGVAAPADVDERGLHAG